MADSSGFYGTSASIYGDVPDAQGYQLYSDDLPLMGKEVSASSSHALGHDDNTAFVGADISSEVDPHPQILAQIGAPVPIPEPQEGLLPGHPSGGLESVFGGADISAPRRDGRTVPNYLLAPRNGDYELDRSKPIPEESKDPIELVLRQILQVTGSLRDGALDSPIAFGLAVRKLRLLITAELTKLDNKISEYRVLGSQKFFPSFIDPVFHIGFWLKNSDKGFWDTELELARNSLLIIRGDFIPTKTKMGGQCCKVCRFRHWWLFFVIFLSLSSTAMFLCMITFLPLETTLGLIFLGVFFGWSIPTIIGAVVWAYANPPAMKKHKKVMKQISDIYDNFFRKFESVLDTTEIKLREGVETRECEFAEWFLDNVAGPSFEMARAAVASGGCLIAGTPNTVKTVEELQGVLEVVRLVQYCRSDPVLKSSLELRASGTTMRAFSDMDRLMTCLCDLLFLGSVPVAHYLRNLLYQEAHGLHVGYFSDDHIGEYVTDPMQFIELASNRTAFIIHSIDVLAENEETKVMLRTRTDDIGYILGPAMEFVKSIHAMDTSVRASPLVKKILVKKITTLETMRMFDPFPYDYGVKTLKKRWIMSTANGI